MMLERIEEEERERLNRARPLEDPYLVGEEAAARARAERVAREDSARVEGGRGDEVLVRENRRWDAFLGEFFFYPLLPPLLMMGTVCDLLVVRDEMADGPLYQSPDEGAGRARAELEALPAGRGPPVEQPASVPHWRAVLAVGSVFRSCGFGVAVCGGLLLRLALGAVRFFRSLQPVLPSGVSSLCIGRKSALVSSLESKGLACWGWQIDSLGAAFVGCCLHEHVWSRISQRMIATYCTMLDLLGFARLVNIGMLMTLTTKSPAPCSRNGFGWHGQRGREQSVIPAVKFQIPVVPALVMTSL